MADGASGNYVAGGASGAASGAMMGGMVGGPPGAIAGGVIGLGMGLLGAAGQNSADKAARKAAEAQKRAMEAEMRRRATGVGTARQQFGDVWSYEAGKKKQGKFDPSRYQDLQKTVLRHGQLAGGIEGEAAAVRDAGAQQLTGAAQGAKAQVTGSMLDRGLLGSSLGVDARKMLLGQYAGGRANVAGATEASREGGWQGLKQQQIGYESMARGGQDISGQMRALSTAGQIAGARSQLPYAAFGNLLNTGMGVLDAGARSEAAGGMGLSAFGLPKLGLAGGRLNTASGATTSTGRI